MLLSDRWPDTPAAVAEAHQVEPEEGGELDEGHADQVESRKGEAVSSEIRMPGGELPLPMLQFLLQFLHEKSTLVRSWVTPILKSQVTP